MKLQCVAFKNTRFNCLVITLGAGKSLKFSKIGEVHDVSDDVGYEIMASHKGMLKQVKEETPKKAPTAAPQNKMASSNRRK